MNVTQLNNIFSQLRELEKIEFHQGEPLGSGGSGQVYPITYVKNGVESENQVLKVIDIVQLARKSAENGDIKPVIREKLNLYKKELEVNKNITACRCEHLIRIYDTYVVDRPFMGEDVCLCAVRMPYYETLEALCQKGDLKENTVIRLGTHICEALSVLHHDAKEEYYRASKYYMGIMVHMDIKPSNIFYRQQGEDIIFMLGDFGTLVDKSKGDVVGGTRGFLAPELIWLLDDQMEQKQAENAISEEFTDKNVTPAESTDIFGLGMTLFYCLAGDDKETLTAEYWDAKCKGATVKKPENCSQQLWDVIEKATDKDPQKRYQTAKEMQSALQNIDMIKAEAAIRENEMLTFETIVMATTIIAGIAERTWKWLKERNGKKERICDGDDVVYEGEVKKGFPHGKGTYVYRYGEEMRMFTGSWRWTEEKIKFLGTKVVYNGMQCDGKYSGFAKIVIPTLGTYRGTVKNLDFETGTFQWEDGSQYTGTWKKMAKEQYCFHGKGIYIDAHGNETIGKWHEDVLVEKY